MPRKTKELFEEKLDKSKKKQPDLKVATKPAKAKKETKSKSASAGKTSEKSTSTSSNNKPKATASKKKTSSGATKATTSKRKTSSSNTKSTSKKISSNKNANISSTFSVEYYDLPIKYDKTLVKILYQNPTTMFVYWEISDKDKLNFKEVYGDNFFEITRPFLVIYNDTLGYNFEIEINDFANSWYFNITDSNCDYRIELIRKPISHSQSIKTDSVLISSSNKVESPNDKILFSTDEPGAVYFKNTKNNSKMRIDLSKLLRDLNLSNKKLGFPIINNIDDLYKFIYNAEDSYLIYSSFGNPSSGNPSSGSFVSKQK